VRYTLEEVFMCDTYVKSGYTKKEWGRFWRKFLDVRVPHRRSIRRTVNKLRQTGSLLDREPISSAQ
jgi:hypothetical protein